MFQTNMYSQWSIRLGLAAVFLWFGIGAFMQPQYWATAWLPESIARLVEATGMSQANFIILTGIFEVLVAASFVTGFFQRWFAAAGALFLVSMMAFHGINETLVRDVGLVGGLIALALWPERRYV